MPRLLVRRRRASLVPMSPTLNPSLRLPSATPSTTSTTSTATKTLRRYSSNILELSRRWNRNRGEADENDNEPWEWICHSCAPTQANSKRPRSNSSSRASQSSTSLSSNAKKPPNPKRVASNSPSTSSSSVAASKSTASSKASVTLSRTSSSSHRRKQVHFASYIQIKEYIIRSPFSTPPPQTPPPTNPIQFSPILASPPSFMFDFSLPPSSPFSKLHIFASNPATIPPTDLLFINLPPSLQTPSSWSPIQIYVPSGITTLSILNGLYDSLQTPLMLEEWEALTSAGMEDVKNSYLRRCALTDTQYGGWNECVRRVDWFGEWSMFDGFDSVQCGGDGDGRRSWLLRVGKRR